MRGHRCKSGSACRCTDMLSPEGMGGHRNFQCRRVSQGGRKEAVLTLLFSDSKVNLLMGRMKTSDVSWWCPFLTPRRH